MQFRTGAKRTETARTDCEEVRWSLEIENNSTSTLNSNLLTNWWWIHTTISHLRVNFLKCCIANAKWMAFAFTEKLQSFTWLTVLRLSCSLQLCTQILCVRNYIAILSARIKAEILRGGVFTRQYWWFAFVFRIVALEYWCLGVSLSIGVCDKLIRAVSVRTQLAEKKRPVIRYIIILVVVWSKPPQCVKDAKITYLFLCALSAKYALHCAQYAI